MTSEKTYVNCRHYPGSLKINKIAQNVFCGFRQTDNFLVLNNVMAARGDWSSCTQSPFCMHEKCHYWHLTFVCIALVLVRCRRKQRRYWVHPLETQRLLKGQFYRICQDSYHVLIIYYSSQIKETNSFDYTIIFSPVWPSASFSWIYKLCSWVPFVVRSSHLRSVSVVSMPFVINQLLFRRCCRLCSWRFNQ